MTCGWEARCAPGCFYPMRGVFRAMARDFDRDGALGLAEVCFYADYQKLPRESFACLKNTLQEKSRPATGP